MGISSIVFLSYVSHSYGWILIGFRGTCSPESPMIFMGKSMLSGFEFPLNQTIVFLTQEKLFFSFSIVMGVNIVIGFHFVESPKVSNGCCRGTLGILGMLQRGDCQWLVPIMRHHGVDGCVTPVFHRKTSCRLHHCSPHFHPCPVSYIIHASTPLDPTKITRKPPCLSILHLVGGLVAIFYVQIYWVAHHPN